ncbi:prospero homeobox protein 2 [Limosa lapponica baueri]|uniref:Prospero homeobox protein 2 n=1 Tax=Limosa lapponica baueri TaxID=1758121 RepID=A0A2I0UHV3_LIMLA|nr:prospero homeobox protein 2 [Limosa lapponica baueri]
MTSYITYDSWYVNPPLCITKGCHFMTDFVEPTLDGYRTALHISSRLKPQTPGKPASPSTETIPNQLRVSPLVSRQEEETMDGSTASEQDRDRAIAVALPQDYECSASPGEGAKALAFPTTRAPASMPCAGDRDQLSDQHLQAKRARVESIIQGMSLPPTPQAFGTSLKTAFGHERERGEQQLRWLQEKFSQVCDSVDAAQTQEGAEKAHPLPEKPEDRPDKDSAAATGNLCKAPLRRSVLEVHGPEEDKDRSDTVGLPSAARVLSQALKDELAGVTSQVVDSVLKTIWPKAASHLLQQHCSLPVLGPGARREYFAAGKCRKPLAKPSPTSALGSLSSPQAEALAGTSGKSPGSHAVSLSSKGVRKPCQVRNMGYPLGSATPVQDSQLLSQLLGCGQHSPWGSSSCRSPSAPERDPPESLNLHWGTVKLRLSLTPRQIQEALTPGHLRKAKLMFFFTRYPSSTLLKTYFLDVQFSRCITSQLIKWFSNFREFYYIQVEKFARQALLEGVVDAGALRVSRDSELFRALNTHYNKGNDFEVPGRFLEVASLTLREFFNAVRAGKDADPSWKKPIYKIISKLDSDIPEGFKATSCSQELLQS